MCAILHITLRGRCLASLKEPIRQHKNYYLKDIKIQRMDFLTSTHTHIVLNLTFFLNCESFENSYGD